MPRVLFLPTGEEVEVLAGETLLQVASREGIPIASTCGGTTACMQCRVRIVEGEENLSPMEYAELSRLGNTFHLTRERLACQVQIHGPVTVEVPPMETDNKRERARRKAMAQAREHAQRRNDRAKKRKAEENTFRGGTSS